MLVLSVAGVCHAQMPDNSVILHSINESNGLSDNHVQCVLKDKSGSVWVGTADGLNEMDGSSIYVFKNKNNDSNSLVNNNILSLAEDAGGNIWIGTSAGLSRYIKQKRKFDNWITPASPYGSSEYIYSIVADHKKNIWCATHGGLLLFDVKTNQFQTFYNVINDKNNSILLRNRITHMIADDAEENLWISSADGLWSFNLDNHQYQKEITADNDPLYKGLFTYVYQTHDHKIWAGTWEAGLVELDVHTGKVSHYLLGKSEKSIIRCINEIRQKDGKYVLWLDGSLSAFDPAAHHFFQYTKLPKEPEAINVNPCYQSSDGWIWLASSTGLYIYNPQHQFFNHHLFPEEITSQITVFTEFNNLVGIGGQAANFLRFYDSNWQERNINSFLNLSQETKGNNNITALSFINQENRNLWIANSEGILKLDLSTGAIKKFQHKEGDSNSLPRNFITHIFLDSRRTLWVFPWREGIWVMDTLTGNCKKLRSGFLNENGKIKKMVIAYATEDENENVWMSDIDEGIILFDRKSGKFSKPFTKQIGEKVRTSEIFFRKGFLYTNTPNAILKWDQNKRILYFFYLPVEMNKEIYNIEPDKDGNWWVATRNGLIVFNETAKTFKRFTSADGLLSNDMNGTFFCRSNGTMLFGTEAYVISFKPAEILSTITEVSLTQLKEVLVNDKTVELSGTPNNFRFDYHSKNIMFRWVLPDFSNPLNNQYYCRLDGIDADWRYVGNKGEIQYANLDYGRYTLQLKSANANGVPSANILTIPFEIAPPIWKTKWFLALIIVVSAVIFFIIVRYVSQRNLKEQLLKLENEQAIEKERNRISRDMHDDLGSGLTKIVIMSEVAKRNLADHERSKQQLESISESSRELVDNLQDIIWVLNPRNDTLESLAAYVREYALKFFEPFGTDLQFIYPETFPDKKLSKETRRNIFLTIKESFNNISKHAWCNKVCLSINNNEGTVIIKIADDGKGFDLGKVRKFSNGLTNMKNRIEQIGGNFEIISEPGKGTVTVVTIYS